MPPLGAKPVATIQRDSWVRGHLLKLVSVAIAPSESKIGQRRVTVRVPAERDGPLAALRVLDLIAQGMGGIMHVTGEPNGPPISVGLPICDLGTGMWAVQGILAALYERQRTARAAWSNARYWRPRSASARGPRRSG